MKYKVTLDYGIQQGEWAEYLEEADDEFTAVRKAIKTHQQKFQGHSTHMLFNNYTIEPA